MNITIRNAEFEDLEAMIGLLDELFAIEADFAADRAKQKRGLKLMLDGCGKHRCVKVAEAGGKVIGMCSAQLLVSTAEGAYSALVEDMVVTESLQKRGVGSMLLNAVTEWSRLRGVTRMQLLADKDNNPALSFYEKQGWSGTKLICLRKADIS
ncbi:Ribosomal protein S18 acetylase RimI [Desulfatibacillum alkenivorans DSM 16219]|jgi:GNAT superfamily N-acetyltransferase|uniref:Ribosomal protein S18 acetylase RimI n=1 Tax=Desulfatibacillum alkenivorans DSM 16219 TaxID=1121393 RepID=A0A1M6WXL1_9BACT|nr:GNAT family N-acetyltransferase [Desulfatibacillum alkenivorans]SHK98467.1 Ribosomal protein S18 acetylase RimI [Desulfatibacillum alkenivorans DSM 16219]